MTIKVNNASNWLPISESKAKPIEVQKQFGSYLKAALNEVNNNQIASNKSTQMLVNNESVELHDVLIAQQKSSISLQLTMEVRNKAIEAYQEIMRMQV